MENNDSDIRIEKASFDDIEDIVAVLDTRCKWLLSKNIDQWGPKYTNRYNKEYFLQKMQAGDECFLAKREEDIVGTMMIEKSSPYFCDDIYDSYYVRHLASLYPGAGKALLDYACIFGKTKGKERICGNCSSKNKKLVQYYLDYGFSTVGKGVNGDYSFFLLSKEI